MHAWLLLFRLVLGLPGLDQGWDRPVSHDIVTVGENDGDLHTMEDPYPPPPKP